MSTAAAGLTALHGRVVFSHGNGFPAGTYSPIFDIWKAAGLEVVAVERFGHDPAYPVASNWVRLRDQLIDFVSSQRAANDPGTGERIPTYLVGHSLGGLLSLMAASRQPGLADGVVLLDSPVVIGWRAHSVRMLKASRLIERLPPGSVAMKRRREWPSRAAVHAHFAAKAVFARWDPRMLDAYVASGFEDRDGKTVLAFQREIETRIYNTLPHDLGLRLRKHSPRCPIAFIAGTQSAELRQAGLAGIRALVGERLRWIEGTHLYPMEKPDATASAVLDCLADFARAHATPSI